MAARILRNECCVSVGAVSESKVSSRTPDHHNSSFEEKLIIELVRLVYSKAFMELHSFAHAKSDRVKNEEAAGADKRLHF